MKKPIKFNSIYGFSTNFALDGEKVKIAFQINCNDKVDKSIMISIAVDDIAYPEVIRRAIDRKLSPDFRLKDIHLIMFGDESCNEILLNEEVKFIGHITKNEGKKFVKGQYLKENDIQWILGLYPSKKTIQMQRILW